MESLDILITNWVRMWNTYDLNQIKKMFHQDITYFSSEKGHLLKGISELNNLHMKFGFKPGGKDSENKLWLEDICTQTYNNTGIVSAIWFFQTASGVIQKGPISFISVNNDKNYKFIHVNVGKYL